MNFYEINRGLFKRLYKYFSEKTCEFENRRDIKKLIKNIKCKPLTKSQIKEIKDYYASFGFKNIGTDWHRYFTHVSGDFYKEYIPDDFFYNVIEPHLNMRVMFPALTDKNILDKLFKDVKQPESVVKNINGIFLDGQDNSIIDFQNVLKKCEKYNKLVIKPSIDSGGGKNIVVFRMNGEITDYKNLTLRELIKLYDKNFIIQNYLLQHEQMNSLNPTSVNTIRFKTLLIHGEVEILSAILRIGGKDSNVDNTRAGGIYCGVNSDGLLNKHGYNKAGERILETHTEILLEGFKIPFFSSIKEEVKDLQRQSSHFKMISWDIAIEEENEAVLIEYNVFGQGYRQENGPLFGKFTDEVLRDCKIKNIFKLSEGVVLNEVIN